MIPNKSLTSISGFVPSTVTVHSGAALTTTVTKVNLIPDKLGSYVRVQISNLTTATNRLAWQIVDSGATAPVISADPASATPGSIINPNKDIFIMIGNNKDLYIVGSAASTVFCVTSYYV